EDRVAPPALERRCGAQRATDAGTRQEARALARRSRNARTIVGRAAARARGRPLPAPPRPDAGRWTRSGRWNRATATHARRRRELVAVLRRSSRDRHADHGEEALRQALG